MRQYNLLSLWQVSKNSSCQRIMLLFNAASVANLCVYSSGFITHRCTPLWTPHRWASACLWSGAYRCAETSTGAQRCRTAPVTTPSACLRKQKHCKSLRHRSSSVCPDGEQLNILWCPFDLYIQYIALSLCSTKNRCVLSGSCPAFFLVSVQL